jgi:hypothetical protein
VHAWRLLLVLALLVLAGPFCSGQAVACDRDTVAKAETEQSQTETRFAASRRETSAQHRHDHQGPHEHEHGCPEGCCMLCCAAAVPHVLTAEPGIFLPPAGQAEPPPPRVVAVAEAGGCLPFRPPRAI